MTIIEAHQAPNVRAFSHGVIALLYILCEKWSPYDTNFLHTTIIRYHKILRTKTIIRCWQSSLSMLWSVMDAEVAGADFEFKEKRMWHFPHCIEAVDGKHIQIQKFWLDASVTWIINIIFPMAMVDPDYKFVYVDMWPFFQETIFWKKWKMARCLFLIQLFYKKQL